MARGLRGEPCMNQPRVALISTSAGTQSEETDARTFNAARGLRAAGVPVAVIHGKIPECPCENIGVRHATGRVLGREGWVSRTLRGLGIYGLTNTSPGDLEVVSRILLSGHSWKLLSDFDVVQAQYAAEVLFFR